MPVVHLMASPSTASVPLIVLYYNYEGFYSVVLVAFVDADYKFIWDWGQISAV